MHKRRMEEIKERCRVLEKQFSFITNAYNKVKEERRRLHEEYKLLDLEMAKIDGRLKIVKTNESSKSTSNKEVKITKDDINKMDRNQLLALCELLEAKKESRV